MDETALAVGSVVEPEPGILGAIRPDLGSLSLSPSVRRPLALIYRFVV